MNFKKRYINKKKLETSLFRFGFLLMAFLCFFSIKGFSQNNLKVNTQNVNFHISSKNEIVEYLNNKFNLASNGLSLKQNYETKSLTGRHIAYTCFFKNVELKDIFIKVHVNKNNQLFHIQENISGLKKFIFIEKYFNKEKISKSLFEAFTINETKEIFILNKYQEFEKAYQVKIYNSFKDTYLERIYFSNDEYKEEDLRVFLSPNDTIIKGKVFLPDPLSSAEAEYGNNYQDGFKKDTSVLIIKTIQNTGQSIINIGVEPFSIYGYTFNLETISVNNNFSNSNIYYIFKDIYFDNNKEAIGYNVDIVDDLANLKTELITEDFDYPELNNERVAIEVLGSYSGSEFKLKNDFFVITNFSPPAIVPYSSGNNNFIFKRSNNAFEEINAYFHLNNFHDYILSLGYNGLDKTQIKIDVHGNNGNDNSFFTNTPSPRIAFGDGGVDDAEDASVVVHEYTHAISDFAAPNTNTGKERQALDEALGDYFSSSYVSTFGNFNEGKVFPWDGHNEFWGGRSTLSDLSYSDLDLKKSIYYNAEIFSATLVDIFNAIGKETTDKLVLESMFYNTESNTFQDVAERLLFVDSILFDGENYCNIYNVLVDRRFKIGVCVGKSENIKEGMYVFNTSEFTKGNAPLEIYIVEENFENMDVWISNALGQIVFKKEQLEKQKILIHPSEIPFGVFYVRIQTKKTKYETKLLKL